jgi:hypothetical protein
MLPGGLGMSMTSAFATGKKMNLSLGMVQVRTTGPPKSPARNQNGLLLF